jgi:hypothetical protein
MKRRMRLATGPQVRSNQGGCARNANVTGEWIGAANQWTLCVASKSKLPW